MVESVLQNCEKVEEYPFPHVNIEGALSQAYYDELYDALPPWQVVGKDDPRKGPVFGNNERRNQPSDTILRDGAEIWKEFVRFHTSVEFYHQFLDLFETHIEYYFPQISKTYGPLRDIPVKRMSGNKKQWGPFALNVLHSINTPITEVSSTRGKHVDSGDSLTAGLLYMADPSDTGGGNFEIYHCEGEPTYGNTSGGGVKQRNIQFPTEEKVAEVPYEPNRFVTLLNTPTSMHSVTPREITPLPRRFVCVYGRYSTNIIHQGK